MTLLLMNLYSNAFALIYWAEYTTSGYIGIIKNDGSAIVTHWIMDENGPQGLEIDSTYIYWGHERSSTIGRAKLDSSEQELNWIDTLLEAPSSVAVDSNYIYWTHQGRGAIGRAKIDGSDIETSWITNLNEPREVVVDSNYIYWINAGGIVTAGSIGRANIDGSSINQNWITEIYHGMQLILNSNYIYWASSYMGDYIGRANLDGSGVDKSWITTCDDPYGVDVDSTHIYWINSSDDSISRATLDKSIIEHTWIDLDQYNPSYSRGIRINSSDINELYDLSIKEATNVTYTTAEITATITSVYHMYNSGVCWGTKSEPEITNILSYNNTDSDTFTSKLTDLYPNTEYFVRAFAIVQTNEVETVYSNEISFTTTAIFKNLKYDDLNVSNDGYFHIYSDATGLQEKNTSEFNPSGNENESAIFSYASFPWISYDNNFYWLAEKYHPIDLSVTTVEVLFDNKTSNARFSQFTIEEIPDVSIDLVQRITEYNIIYTYTFNNLSIEQKKLSFGFFNDLDCNWSSDYKHNYVGFYHNGAFIKTTIDEQVSLLTENVDLIDGITVFIHSDDGTLNTPSAYYAYEIVQHFQGKLSHLYGKFVEFNSDDFPPESILSTENFDVNNDNLSDVTSDVSLAIVWEIVLPANTSKTLKMAFTGGNLMNSEINELFNVSVQEPTNITYTTAEISATVTSVYLINESGVCWGTKSEPEITNILSYNNTDSATFTSKLTDLSPNTEYFVRAFAIVQTNEVQIVYSNEVSFTTASICKDLNNNLGLNNDGYIHISSDATGLQEINTSEFNPVGNENKSEIFSYASYPIALR